MTYAAKRTSQAAMFAALAAAAVGVIISAARLVAPDLFDPFSLGDGLVGAAGSLLASVHIEARRAAL